MGQYTVFTSLPPDFFPSIEIAGCFCECDGTFLMMKRHMSRIQGGLWNLPAGKFEAGETPIDCASREVFEEAGIVLDKKMMTSVGILYISIPECNYVFHIFKQRFTAKPTVNLKLDEHDEYLWTTLQEALSLPLIAAGNEVLLFCQ